MNNLSARNFWIIYREQSRGIPLDLKGGVLRPRQPLARALSRLVPLSRDRVETVIAERKDRGRILTGFVQARWRSNLPLLDLLFIAPSLEAQPGVAWLWQTLIHELVRVSGGQGAQRLFIRLPEECPGEVEVMRQAGFALYCQDRIYRREPLASNARIATHLWQPRHLGDEWGLLRLYNALTPSVVQQAEAWGQNGNGHNGTKNPVVCGNATRGCYVLRGRLPGEVLGFLRITPGECGHWLKVVLHPDLSHRADALLREALSLLSPFPRRPIFCDVREYEGHMTEGLERSGFHHITTRLLLVRHTTVAIREVVHRPIPVLDVETAPTVYPSLHARRTHCGQEPTVLL